MSNKIEERKSSQKNSRDKKFNQSRFGNKHPSKTDQKHQNISNEIQKAVVTFVIDKEPSFKSKAARRRHNRKLRKLALDSEKALTQTQSPESTSSVKPQIANAIEPMEVDEIKITEKVIKSQTETVKTGQPEPEVLKEKRTNKRKPRNNVKLVAKNLSGFPRKEVTSSTNIPNVKRLYSDAVKSKKSVGTKSVSSVVTPNSSKLTTIEEDMEDSILKDVSDEFDQEYSTLVFTNTSLKQ